MKKLIIGLLTLTTLNAFAYAPNGKEIRNFVNDGLITEIREYIDIKAGEGPKRVNRSVYVYCRECPTENGRQCQQFQFQNGDTAINLVPGDAQLIDGGILIRCLGN